MKFTEFYSQRVSPWRCFSIPMRVFTSSRLQEIASKHFILLHAIYSYLHFNDSRPCLSILVWNFWSVWAFRHRTCLHRHLAGFNQSAHTTSRWWRHASVIERTLEQGADKRQCLVKLLTTTTREKISLMVYKVFNLCATPCHALILSVNHLKQLSWLSTKANKDTTPSWQMSPAGRAPNKSV